MKSILLSLFCLTLLTNCSIERVEVDPQTDTLLEGFKEPPTSAKPKGYWCLVNGNYDLSKMTEELKEYKEKGVGTLDLWDVAGWVDENGVVPAGPSFMGDESLQAIAHAIREAGKIGIDIGLTISSSWNAGGDWVQPEDGAMGLFYSSIKVTGPKSISTNIKFPKIPLKYKNRNENILFKDSDGLPTFYREVAVVAYQFDSDSTLLQVVDLSSSLQDGKIVWDVPDGDWEITRYVCTGTGQPLMRPSPNSNGLMIDHFSADAMKKHLNFFFEKLETELGNISETALKYLYTDSYEANTAVWTVKMPEEFKDRVGYDITPYLPALKGFTIENKKNTERFLFDFRKVLSDLIIENHYVLGTKMCEEKGIEFIAEAGGPGPPIHNVPFESLSSLGKLSAPRGEFWFDTMWDQKKIDQLQIVKGPASAAHLYNRPRVEAEAFTGTQLWQFGPGDIKPTADKAMCEGLTSFVYHTSPHSPSEAGTPGWVYNFGTIINTTRTWWPLSSGFHKYLGRSCFMLQQGNFIADVLYYYGDYAPNFVEPKHIDPDLGFGYDYDITNSDIILNHLDVVDGYFTLPHGQKYKILVLPDDEAMDPEVLKRISELVKKGGILIGRKPVRSHSLYNFEKNDSSIQELASSIWKGDYKTEYGNGLVFDRSKSLKEILSEIGIQPDIKLAEKNSEKHFDFIHRQTDSEDIYFFRNRSDTTRVFNIAIRSTLGAPEKWNPDDGKTTNVSVFSQAKGFTHFPLKLGSYSSTFIVLRKGISHSQISKITRNGQEIFPKDCNEFPIFYFNDETILDQNGDYEFTFVDGRVTNSLIADGSSYTISGEWEIRFPYGQGTPTRIVFDDLISWTESEDDAIKHFSGVAIYNKTILLEKRKESNEIYLDLGKVSKVVRVYLNGSDLGIRWFAPYTYNISNKMKEGENHLIIEVANVMTNQLVGDSKRSGEEKRTHTNITKGPNAWMTPHKDLDLIESGLLGPVKIVTFQKIQ